MFIVRDGDTTIAFSFLVDEELRAIPYAGAAKRCKGDPENTTRGENLAVGRAYRNLGRTLLKIEYDNINKQFHRGKYAVSSKKTNKEKTQKQSQKCLNVSDDGEETNVTTTINFIVENE